MGMPGKFARIQPRSRLALMSLIRRRRAMSLVEPIRPEAPEPAGEHGSRRSEVLLAPVAGPQVLPAPKVFRRSPPCPDGRARRRSGTRCGG